MQNAPVITVVASNYCVSTKIDVMDLSLVRESFFISGVYIFYFQELYDDLSLQVESMEGCQVLYRHSSL